MSEHKHPLKNVNAWAFQEYYISVSTVSGPLSVTSDCADITFYNAAPITVPPAAATGSDVIVNGIVLQPGIGVSISANNGELDKTQYLVNFANPALIRNCVVIRKYYRQGN